MHTITSCRPFCVLAIGLLFGLAPGRLPAATLHVAPDGNDAWSGKLERPNAGPLGRPAGHAGRRQGRRAAAEGPRTVEGAGGGPHRRRNLSAPAKRWSSSRKTAARPKPRSSIKRPTERGRS